MGDTAIIGSICQVPSLPTTERAVASSPSPARERASHGVGDHTKTGRSEPALICGNKLRPVGYGSGTPPAPHGNLEMAGQPRETVS